MTFYRRLAEDRLQVVQTIVIVDDDPTITQILKAFIKKSNDENYDIVTFDEIVDACDYLTEHPVDLLFEDVHVQSNSDGLIVAQIAKNFGVPVVIITADVQVNVIKDVARGHYDKLILKPIVFNEVRSSLELIK